MLSKKLVKMLRRFLPERDRKQAMQSFLAQNKLIIGMVHLLPLPGSPHFNGSLSVVEAQALEDAKSLVEGGVNALMVENFGDSPFFPGLVPPVTVAMMSVLGERIRKECEVPFGINVLRNDAVSALSVALAAQANFIRVNILTGARLTDQGVIEGRAHEVLRTRLALGAKNIAIAADIDVKHSVSLAPRSLESEVEETIHRAGAEVLIVSGAGTGKATPIDKLKAVKAVSGNTPVWVGSGVTKESVRDYVEYADGFIVGTAFKKRGQVSEPVEVGRVKEFVKTVVSL